MANDQAADADDDSAARPPNCCITCLFSCVLKIFLLTVPKSWGCYTFQAPMLAYFKPGYWLCYLFGIPGNSWHGTMELKGNTREKVFECLVGKVEGVKKQVACLTGNDVLVDADFVVPKRHYSKDGNTLTLWFFTRNKQWMDVIELEGAGDSVLRVRSLCACIAPASLPGSLFLGMLLWWFPFQDVGQNKAHVYTLAQLLQDNGLPVEVSSKGWTRSKKVANNQAGS